MFLTPYHRECLKLARSSPAWEYGETAPCVVCKQPTPFTNPAGRFSCAWCFDWSTEFEQPTLPPTGPPLPDCSKLPCPHCKLDAAPDLEWRLAGPKKKTLAIGAYCARCERWLKWVGRAFHPYAPPLPFVAGEAEWVLFDTAEAEVKPQGYVDTSLGIRKPVAIPAPPEVERRATPEGLCKALSELWRAGDHLYVTAAGKLACVRPWKVLKAVDAELLVACAEKVVTWLTDDVENQLQRARCTPHVVRAPTREALRKVEAWRAAEAGGWRYEDFFQTGEPSTLRVRCATCRRATNWTDPKGVRRHPWCQAPAPVAVGLF